MPFLNRVQMTVSASNSSSITLGSAYAANAATMAGAGAVNGATYSYVLTDGNKFEIQQQQAYTSSGGTMARGTPKLAWDGSTFSTTQITLSGSAVFSIEVLSEDLLSFLTAAGGTLTGPLNFASPATVASAATTDIGAAASNVVNITGTTTITALGSITAGAMRWATFAGALTLTHNATSLILPGGANITTAAGDAAIFVSLGSGNWKCLDYIKADGSPTNGFATIAQFLAATANKIMEPANTWASGAEVTITPPSNIASLTLTFTNGSSTITSSAAHGLSVGDPLHITTGGTLPTNFTAGQELWVVSVGSTTTFTASATRGGTAITAGSAGSGTHTLNKRLLLDCATFINAKVTLAGSITVATPVNIVPGRAGRIKWLQDATGGRTRTYPTGGVYQAAGGASTIAALSTAASAKDYDYYDAVSSTEFTIGAAPLKAVAA